MIPGAFDYHLPDTLAEVHVLLQRYGSEAKLLAGGHSLIPLMKLREVRPGVLVDLANIPGLRGIQGGDNVITVGALTSHSEIEHNLTLKKLVSVLPRAAKVVSDPLIRNRGTFGGSLAEAHPEGDWPAVALALDARIRVSSPQGERIIPVDAFFLDSHLTTLAPEEVLTAVDIPVPSTQTRTTYLKRMHPASGYAMIGVAVAVEINQEGVCTECRVAVTGAGRVATRARASEAFMTGRTVTTELIEAAAARSTQDISFQGDHYGSAHFREHLVPVYVGRALVQAAFSQRHAR